MSSVVQWFEKGWTYAGRLCLKFLGSFFFFCNYCNISISSRFTFLTDGTSILESLIIIWSSQGKIHFTIIIQYALWCIYWKDHGRSNRPVPLSAWRCGRLLRSKRLGGNNRTDILLIGSFFHHKPSHQVY